jgi:hypothetical protein
VQAVARDLAAHRAVETLTGWLATGEATNELAVLARVNSALLPVQVALTEAGVPHTAPLDATVLGRTGVRTALAYLRLGLDLEHLRREDVLDTINRPARKVKSAVQPLLPRGRSVSIRQLEQLGDALDPTHADRFGDYLGDLRSLGTAIADGTDTAGCLRLIRDRIGLGEAMDALDSSRTRPEGSSHGDDLDALEQLAALHPSPASFRDWLTDRLRVPGRPDGVTLSTIHRVKGMEWDRVVVYAANAGLFPHRLAEDVEEERRIFHVAVTRCRRSVEVVADRDRTSPFVAELTRPARRRARQVPVEGAPVPGAAGPADEARGGCAPAVPTRLPTGAVAAVAGLEVTLPGGFQGRIVAIDDDGAVVAARLADTSEAATRMRVAFGSPVRVAQSSTTLAPSPRRTGRPAPGATRAAPGVLDVGGAGTAGRARTSPPAGRAGEAVGAGADGTVASDDAGDAELFEALRAWRARIAGDAGVPAYLVFHDRHLQTIATRRPRTLRELAACPGVGPVKLERYGDDLLDLVDQHG